MPSLLRKRARSTCSHRQNFIRLHRFLLPQPLLQCRYALLSLCDCALAQAPLGDLEYSVIWQLLTVDSLHLTQSMLVSYGVKSCNRRHYHPRRENSPPVQERERIGLPKPLEERLKRKIQLLKIRTFCILPAP